MSGFNLTRRDFLKATGASAVALSFRSLGFSEGEAEASEKVIREWEYGQWEDLFREEWTWDKVTFGTHLVDCYPGNCLWRVYTKEGIVWREEQAGIYPVVDPTGPDWNPRGCQKGCTYSHMMYNPDRVKYPMKRVGERGSGKWKRISWDEATDEIAVHIVNALESHGPESIIFEGGPGNGGWINLMPAMRFTSSIGGTSLDINATIGDFNKGIYETFGKFQFMDSCDAWFFGKLLLIWHMNPIYTRIPSYHFIAEARYNGAEVITIAPDYSPSAMHADEWIPMDMGGDAALGLAMAQVLMEEGKVDWGFVKEQSDFPMLIRSDTKRFLRGEDMEEGGLEDQLYYYDAGTKQPVKAPRGTLALPIDPALEGTFHVTLLDGSQVEVRTSYSIFKDQLDAEYRPEQATEMCGVPASTIRRLAKKAHEANGHVQILVGWNSSKYYHGDLIERAMCLLLVLTGSIGKKGAGIRGWNESLFDGATRLMATKERMSGRMTFDIDPTWSQELTARAMEMDLARKGEFSVPPVFLYYFHSGYKETWNKQEWHDPAMKRSFDEYMTEAIDKGWWDGLVRPAPDQPPQVYFFQGTSPVRKNRGWETNLKPTFWKNLKFIFTLETRFSTSALLSDMILPAAGFYEKTDTRFPTPHVPWLTLTDKAVEPIAESKTEWDIWKKIAEKVEKEAISRGATKLTMETTGRTLDISTLVKDLTLNIDTAEEALDGALKLSAAVGQLPKGANLEKMREEGIFRFTDISKADVIALHLATDIKPDEPIIPLTHHTGPKKQIYPTYNRRIQFYIDHEWFLEAGEGHPVHKENPKMGGDYPLLLTSGHQRWSIHSIWVTDTRLLRTHQGRPFAFLSPEDAEKRGIKDGDLIHVFNDFDDFKIHVKIQPGTKHQEGARPGQLIIYHAWEPIQFEGWKSYDASIPGMVKWLDLAAGYGHLNYYRWNWAGTQPVDRAIAIDVELA